MQDSTNSILKSGLVLALAIAGFLGYLYFKEKRKVDVQILEIKEKSAEVMETNSRLDSLARELDIKISELADLGHRVEELQAVRLDLERDKNRLLSNNGVNLKEFNSKIAEYEALIRKKERQIAEVLGENTKLVANNTKLGNENKDLKVYSDVLKTENVALADTVVRYSERNKELSDKVTIAAALRPTNYLVTAISKRGKERDGEEFKSKRVDRVKISFKLAENALTKKENKTIYLRIIDPRGNVLSDMALGSGAFNFGGKETVYTAKQVINYTNANQTVDFYYDREAKYEKGNHIVELYAEGFRIGQTNFAVK